MKKLILYLSFAVLVFALASCSLFQSSPTPTEEAAPAEEVVAPTEAQAEAPAEAPTEAQAEAPAEAPTEAQAEAPAEAPAQPPPLIGTQTDRLRTLDFAPFEDALAGFSSDREAAVDAVVRDATIADIQAALEGGDLTSEELTLYFLSRIRRYDETLRTFSELNPTALDEARAADAQRAEGTVLGPLHGIPVNLKDNIGTTAPLHTTGGAEILLDHAPAQDASLVAQLREAGAVILGKANLSELAGGVAAFPAGYSAVAGQTINPHGAGFPTLGSSSGSAASTAAYLTTASVGSETAGSLIAPSALDGVIGMYPTDDLVSDDGVIPLISSTDTPGPIARTVTDAAILLGVIDTADVDYTAALDPDALQGVTAGFLAADLAPSPILGLNGFEDTSDQEAKLQQISDLLEKAGAVPTAVEITRVEGLEASDALIMQLYGEILASEGINSAADLTDEIRTALGGQIPSLMIMNNYLGALVNGGVAYDMVGYLADAGAPVSTLAELAAYNREMPERRIPHGQFQIDGTLPAIEAGFSKEAYEQVAGVAQQIAASALDGTFEATGAEILVSMVNEHSPFYAAAGYPAITVPLGLRPNGAPTGVTFIGKPGTDAQLLAYAYAFEQATMLRENPDLDAVAQ